MRKRGSHSYSTTAMITWNDDVLTEILLRLPAKSLIRFKLVSKHWLSLISSHQFCLLHTCRSQKPQPSLIVVPARTSLFFYFHPVLNPCKLIPYTFSIPNPKILSSSNGLLLLQSGHQQMNYYVYNPTTKQSRKITLMFSNKYPEFMGLNLAFDPTKSPHYKIVCIRAVRRWHSDRERSCQIELYDSESCTWKVCLEPFTTSTQVDFPSGVHWNNAVHWQGNPNRHFYFNIDKMVVGNLPNAAIPWHGGGGGVACRCQFQESNGHLYHFIIVSHLGDKSIAVYELQEDYSQWLLKYHDGFGRLPGMSRILSFIGGDEGETCTLVIHVPGKIMVYRFVDQIYEEILDLTNQTFYEEDSLQFDSKDVHQFGETLAPV